MSDQPESTNSRRVAACRSADMRLFYNTLVIGFTLGFGVGGGFCLYLFW